MHMRPFEIGLIGASTLAALIGLLWFANYQAKPNEVESRFGEKVLIWGTASERVVQGYFEEQAKVDPAYTRVQYVAFSEDTFENSLVNALAEGRGPDVVFYDSSQLVSLRSKIYPLREEELSIRTFKDTYVDGAEIFDLSDGIYGYPVAVDPLMMYVNQDLVSSAGIPTVPKTWEEFLSEGLISSLTLEGSDSMLTQSAVAMGEYVNVTNAKAIITSLLLQAGTDLIKEDANGYLVEINKIVTGGLPTGEAAFGFYSQFAQPTKSTYSWNRSREPDKRAFTGGTLAFYFGKGSERTDIERANANLNIDIALFPQGSGATVKRVYGDFYALSVLKASPNKAGALQVAKELSGVLTDTTLAQMLGLTPAIRGLYGKTNDPWQNVIERSALYARSWLDPDKKGSDDLMRQMVEDIGTGRLRIKDAMIEATYDMQTLFE